MSRVLAIILPMIRSLVLFIALCSLLPSAQAQRTSLDDDAPFPDLSLLSRVSYMGGRSGLPRVFALQWLTLHMGFFTGNQASLSLNGIFHRGYEDRGEYPVDPRLTPVLNFAVESLKPLNRELPLHPMGLRTAAHVLSLLSDPDRMFILAGLASVQWKLISEAELKLKLPTILKEHSKAIYSYREGSTVYLNQSEAEGLGNFSENLMEGIENWVLLEGMKLWLNESYRDFRTFYARFGKMLMSGETSDFKVKNAQGVYDLVYFNAVEQIEADVRKTTPGIWNLANTLYKIESTPAGVQIRFIGPTLVRKAGSPKYQDAISLQYTKSWPDPIYTKNKLEPIETTLICEELQALPKGEVRLIPQVGTILVGANLQIKWLGLKPQAAQTETTSFSSTEDCATQLKVRAAESLRKQMGEFHP